MSANRFYREVEDYINDTVTAFALPINNIESIKCARRGDRFYLELVHEDSMVRYFDISAMDISDIGIMMGYILANRQIPNEIHDRVAKKEIRQLFK